MDPISHLLAPGAHSFHSAPKNLTFEYIVHTNNTTQYTHLHTKHLIVIHPPAWGLGSSYLQHGLQPLLVNPNATSNSTTSPSSYTLLYFHPRGTGNSSRPQSRSQMSSLELATDLEDLRIHLNLSQLPTLLGHSNGGAIALAYAEMYPERVGRLVLVDPQLIGVKKIVSQERERRVKPRTKGNQNRGMNGSEGEEKEEEQSDSNALFTNLRADPRYARVLNSRSGLDKSSDKAFTASVNAMWAFYFSDPRRYVPELLSAIGNHEMPVWCHEGVYGSDREYEESAVMVRRLGDVRAKTLIIAGREDWICRVSSAERTRDGIPGAKLVVCEGCGHFPWIEAREETFREIRELVEET